MKPIGTPPRTGAAVGEGCRGGRRCRFIPRDLGPERDSPDLVVVSDAETLATAAQASAIWRE